jgi:hypothetical protein
MKELTDVEPLGHVRMLHKLRKLTIFLSSNHKLRHVDHLRGISLLKNLESLQLHLSDCESLPSELCTSFTDVKKFKRILDANR